MAACPGRRATTRTVVVAGPEPQLSVSLRSASIRTYDRTRFKAEGSAVENGSGASALVRVGGPHRRLHLCGDPLGLRRVEKGLGEVLALLEVRVVVPLEGSRGLFGDALHLGPLQRRVPVLLVARRAARLVGHAGALGTLTIPEGRVGGE